MTNRLDWTKAKVYNNYEVASPNDREELHRKWLRKKNKAAKKVEAVKAGNKPKARRSKEERRAARKARRDSLALHLERELDKAMDNSIDS